MTVFTRAGVGLRQLFATAMRLLRTWPWFDTLRTLRLRFRDDHLGVTASSLTFTTLIALVPLVTVMLALTQFAGKASRLGGVGLVLLLLTALALVFTIDRTLNGIWRVPRPRPLAQRVLLYWAALTLGPVLLGASLTITSYAVSASRGLVNRLPGGLDLLLELLQFGLMAAATTCLYRFVPNTVVRWPHAWAGGVFVALGLELAKRALAWYVSTVPTYSVIYGAFATLPILLLWIYLGWVIVLLGAVIAAYAPTLAIRVARLPNRPGEQFALALRVLQRLAWAQGAGQGAGGAQTQVALAAALRVDPLQVGQVLEVLHGLDWVGRLDEPGDPRWLLLAHLQHTPAAPLVDALLLAETEASAAFRRSAGLARMTLGELLVGAPP